MKVEQVLDNLKRRFPNEPEYLQAVEEVLHSIEEEYNAHPEFEKQNLIERLCIPERIFSFRITWVDDKGNVIMRRERISQLMQQFPQIDREKNGTPFQTTHAVRLGSHGKSALTKRSGLMIDGGPLTHPCLDHVDGIGRMALADSAAPKKKNM